MNAKLKYPKYEVMEALCNQLFDIEPLSKNTLLFSLPMGMNGKTHHDTSMRISRILPVPESFTLKANPEVALFKEGELIQITDPIWTEFHLTFLVNSKRYINGPLFTFAHPVAILKDFEKLDEEQKKILRTRQLLYDIPINPLDPFHVDVDGAWDYPNVSIYCGLPGINTRAI